MGMLRTAVVWLLALVACSSPPTYHEDVKPILQASCVQCHSEGGTTPFALTSFESVKQLAPAIVVAAQNRTMPPWSASSEETSYRNDPSLTDSQIETIREWQRAGALEGDPKDGSGTVEPAVMQLDRVDEVIGLPKAYEPSGYPDDYRCFPIAWPKQTSTYVLGFNALPGNRSLVHHIAVYNIPPSYAGLPFEWEQEDSEVGYTCFGGPSGGRDQTFPTLLLSAWVPGNGPTVLPDGLGIEVKPGSTLVFQVHYNTELGLGETDQSSFEFQLSDEVERKGVYAPWLDVNWVFGGMQIPAGEKDVAYSIKDDPRGFFDMFISDFDLEAGFNIHSAMFHMHKLGSAGLARLVAPDGTTQTILDIPEWDFDWQREYQLEAPIVFSPGDSIELQCVWNNSDENQLSIDGTRREARDVSWGEGTSDEMCVVNLLISER